ncbi:MAG: hypothetical protein HAW67_06775, partial [Endozoicomonadaceae bacterium]|nr:hypothetical protein [Endozoicomonadaceae bacterium]
AGDFSFSLVNQAGTTEDKTTELNTDYNVEVVLLDKPFIGNIDDFNSNGVKTLFGNFIARYPGALGNGIEVYVANSASYEIDKMPSGDVVKRAYASNFNITPDNGQIHILVIDKSGKFTGTANSILEKYEFLDISDEDRNFWADRITEQSSYIWAGDEVLTFGTSNSPESIVELLSGGADGIRPDRLSAWSLLEDAERYNNVGIFFTGASDSTLSSQVVLIAENRQDVVVCVSPNNDIVTDDNHNLLPIMDSPNDNRARIAIATYFNRVGNSSYVFTDTAWGQLKDDYNNRFIWVPLNGETAGLLAITERDSNVWTSPSGHTKGVYRNFSRISYNPSKIDRDFLYPLGINPVIEDYGSGKILFGDKTLLQKPSAFDRINVRRLFILLRKSISDASKYTLFENNNEITRLSYYNQINAFLTTIRGQGGIQDFRVIIDGSNNTPDIIARNTLVGDILVTPVRSINFIDLRFTATDNLVSFEEIEQQ